MYISKSWGFVTNFFPKIVTKLLPPDKEQKFKHRQRNSIIEILIIWISRIQNTWIYCSTWDSIAASRAKPECCNTVPSAAINPSILNAWNSNYKYLNYLWPQMAKLFEKGKSFLWKNYLYCMNFLCLSHSVFCWNFECIVELESRGSTSENKRWT